jgi:hypothetical protein
LEHVDVEIAASLGLDAQELVPVARADAGGGSLADRREGPQ